MKSLSHLPHLGSITTRNLKPKRGAEGLRTDLVVVDVAVAGDYDALLNPRLREPAF